MKKLALSGTENIPGLPLWLSGEEFTCQGRRHGFSPWVGKIPWRRRWLSLQYSCLGSPMDRGDWRATVRGVAKCQTQQSDLNSSNNKGEDSIGRMSRVHSGHCRFEVPIKQASGSIERQNGDSGVKLLNHFLSLWPWTNDPVSLWLNFFLICKMRSW